MKPDPNILIKAAGRLKEWPVFGRAVGFARGGRIFLVGGFVRDRLLNRPWPEPLEVDLATAGPAVELARELADQTGGSLVVLSEADQTARIVWPGLLLDLTAFRRPSLEADLAARDFTVNAIAIGLAGLLSGEAEIIDPTGGLEDLAAQRLIVAGPGVVAADPLRSLRGYRLAAELELELPESTRRALLCAAPGIRLVAGERISAELQRILLTPASAAWLGEMAEDKFLGFILPEVAGLAGLYQNRYHHLDGLKHTLATLAEAESLLRNAASGQGPDWPGLEEIAAQDENQLVIKLAALYHDVGKRARARVSPVGEPAYPGHAKLSAQLWLQAAGRLRLSRNMTRAVHDIIKGHMRPLSILMSSTITPRALRRMAVYGGDHLAAWGLLCLADAGATRGPASDPAFSGRIVDLWRQLFEVQAALKRQAEAPLVRGDELIDALGIQPGPLVGRLLGEIDEQRLTGRLTDKEGALKWAQKRLKQVKKKPYLKRGLQTVYFSSKQ